MCIRYSIVIAEIIIVVITTENNPYVITGYYILSFIEVWLFLSCLLEPLLVYWTFNFKRLVRGLYDNLFYKSLCDTFMAALETRVAAN